VFVYYDIIVFSYRKSIHEAIAAIATPHIEGYSVSGLPYLMSLSSKGQSGPKRILSLTCGFMNNISVPRYGLSMKSSL